MLHYRSNMTQKGRKTLPTKRFQLNRNAARKLPSYYAPNAAIVGDRSLLATFLTTIKKPGYHLVQNPPKHETAVSETDMMQEADHEYNDEGMANQDVPMDDLPNDIPQDGNNEGLPTVQLPNNIENDDNTHPEPPQPPNDDDDDASDDGRSELERIQARLPKRYVPGHRILNCIWHNRGLKRWTIKRELIAYAESNIDTEESENQIHDTWIRYGDADRILTDYSGFGIYENGRPVQLVGETPQGRGHICFIQPAEQGNRTLGQFISDTQPKESTPRYNMYWVDKRTYYEGTSPLDSRYQKQTQHITYEDLGFFYSPWHKCNRCGAKYDKVLMEAEVNGGINCHCKKCRMRHYRSQYKISCQACKYMDELYALGTKHAGRYLGQCQRCDNLGPASMHCHYCFYKTDEKVQVMKDAQLGKGIGREESTQHRRTGFISPYRSAYGIPLEDPNAHKYPGIHNTNNWRYDGDYTLGLIPEACYDMSNYRNFVYDHDKAEQELEQRARYLDILDRVNRRVQLIVCQTSTCPLWGYNTPFCAKCGMVPTSHPLMQQVYPGPTHPHHHGIRPMFYVLQNEAPYVSKADSYGWNNDVASRNYMYLRNNWNRWGIRDRPFFRSPGVQDNYYMRDVVRPVTREDDIKIRSRFYYYTYLQHTGESVYTLAEQKIIDILLNKYKIGFYVAITQGNDPEPCIEIPDPSTQ